MASIKDVAKQAGVSTATVSRVLNQSQLVSPDTEKIVREAIEILDYTPNNLARSLKTKETHLIGFLVSDISNNYFTAMAKSIELSISSFGYNLIVCSTDNSESRERDYLQILQSKKVDAILLNTTGKNDELVLKLSKRMPIILLERKLNNTLPVGDFITYDTANSVSLLVNHLVELGHKKIAVINGPLDLSSACDRYNSFVKTMTTSGYKRYLTDQLRVDSDFSVEGGYFAAEKIMSGSLIPSAIVVMNNNMALGALKYFKKQNIRIPEDVSICCVGEIENSDVLYVDMSHTTQNPVELGSAVSKCLISRLEEPNRNNEQIVLETHLYVGNTTTDVRP